MDDPLQRALREVLADLDAVMRERKLVKTAEVVAALRERRSAQG